MTDSKKIELSCNKPLLIYGNPGSGKTYLALELLKDTILLRIDVSQIKGNKDMKNYILDRLKKRNVTLMFNEIKEQRGLLIDDIHIFHKYDKSCFKSLIEFLRGGVYYKSKIIITCCKSRIKNKDICKLKIDRHEIKYTYSEYYKLCLEIVKHKKLKIDLENCDSKIYDSKYNLNIFLSECEQKNDKVIKDNYDGTEEITRKIFTDSYSMERLFRICVGDEKIILLNLIENIKDNYVDIYHYCDLFNRADIFTRENQFLTIPIKMINSKNNSVINELIYNRYISKNMVKYKNLKNDKLSEKIIYLIDTYRMTEEQKYKDELLKIDSKIISIHISIYENLYDIKSLYQLN